MHARAEFLIYKLNYYDKIFLKVYKYFLLTCLQAEQVYPERGGGLPLVLQQPHAAADHERDGGGPREVHLQVTCTGCPSVPQYWFHFVFCHFLGFWSTYRGASDLYSTALEICYIIATRILKIDLKIAEIIEVKVDTCNTKLFFLLFVIAKCQFLNDGCQL